MPDQNALIPNPNTTIYNIVCILLDIRIYKKIKK
jgi:hypothetical protein